MKQKLSTGYKLRFAFAELGFTTLRAVVDFFLLFYYTDVAGINPAVASSALLVGRLTWDAINDPLVGWFSDRTRSRFGRRRIFMLVAAVPLAVFTWLQLSLPQGLSGAAAFGAVLLSFWLKDTFVTLAIVPYAALMAEVTHDYRERSSLALFKSISSVMGYLIGAGSVMVLVGTFRGMGWDLAGAWSMTGAVFGVIALIALLTTTFSIQETAPPFAETSSLPMWEGVRMCFRNRPFVILMVVFLLGSFAFTAQAALLPYLIQYQLRMQPQLTIIMVLSLSMTGLFAPVARLLADRINKGPTYALGLTLASLTFLLAFLFLPHEPTPWVYGVAVMLGISFSAQWVLPFAMLPDVIEYDEKLTGKRREGIYYGLNNFLSKFSNALGVAVPGWALAWYGYVPNAVQTESALFGIRFFYAVVPAVAMLICVPILLKYPITKESHAALLQELAAAQPAEAAG
jgi:glycoside/pentoside/hexuronide:cation symporter, GPH family